MRRSAIHERARKQTAAMVVKNRLPNERMKEINNNIISKVNEQCNGNQDRELIITVKSENISFNILIILPCLLLLYYYYYFVRSFVRIRTSFEGTSLFVNKYACILSCLARPWRMRLYRSTSG